jgi:Flp pilus assembly secretin CpaC
MQRKNSAPRTLWRGVLLSVVLGSWLPASAWGQAGYDPAPDADPFRLPVGTTQRLRMRSTDKPIRNIFNERPNIATVQQLVGDPNKTTLITGSRLGYTRLILVDDEGREEVRLVEVYQPNVPPPPPPPPPVLEQLKAILKQAVPTASVVPIFGPNNTMILTGTVARVEDIEVVLRLANSVVGNSQGNARFDAEEREDRIRVAQGIGGNQQTNGAAGPENEAGNEQPGEPPAPAPTPGAPPPSGPQRRYQVINALRVGGVMQVQLDVVVARVARSEFRRMQFDFLDVGQKHILASVPALGGIGATPGTGPGAAPGVTLQGTPPSNIFLAVFDPQQSVFAFLQALRQENLVKLIAEPRLVTLSGRPATFQSGGDQAVPEITGFNSVGVRFEPFGTQLTFLPIVLGNGKIYLEVAPTVSSLDAASGVSVSGGFVPGRVRQLAQTSVELEPGHTLAIGGLIQRSVQGTTSKIPVLGDVPFLGAAFSGKTFQEVEEELLILVTPHLVDGMTCDQLPKLLPGQETRSPDDFELFLEGILEAPRGPREVFPNKGYVPAYRHGPTANVFPCAGPGTCGPAACAAPGAPVKPPPQPPSGAAALPKLQPAPLHAEGAAPQAGSEAPAAALPEGNAVPGAADGGGEAPTALPPAGPGGN